jgi:hypothetical protein
VPLFSYFTSRTRELGENNIAKLRNAPIVPVVRKQASEKRQTTVSHISPAKAYLGQSITYGGIFDFVDFGQDANAFLYTCGAKTEPTKLEVAHMACSEPARLLSILQSPEKYLDLLKSLAEASSTLHRDKELWRKMKSSAFLLAYKELAAPNKEALIDIDDEDTPVRHYQLSAPNQIVVLDDIISYRLFKDHLICAPEEDALEKFYLALGAQKLSSIVQEDIRIGPHTDRSKKAEVLRKHVLERSKIFLYEYVNYRRDAIKHDTKWLEKNLRVDMVTSVALRRTLKGQRQSHTEKRSAAGAHTNGSWVLYVADDGKPDMYQVGQAICQMLLDRPNQQAYLFFEPFLTLDLYGLRARGYNVDRILRAKAAEARIAEEERQKALAEEQRQIRERESKWAQEGRGSSDGSPSTAVSAPGHSEVPQSPEPNSVMPGSWDSPETMKPDISQYAKKGRNLFSNLSRRFGFDNDDSNAQQQLDQFVKQPNEQSPDPSASQGNKTRSPEADDGRVTNPAVIQQNLLNAINATRPHGSSTLFSDPKVNEVKEQATYCDETAAKNLSFAAEASNGMKVFIAKDVAANFGLVLAENGRSINAFAGILDELANVYSLARNALHIFYDESGSTIAFNSGGSIFCNLRFFMQLHAKRLGASPSGEAKAEAATWWWVVLAHELAHNLVSLHNAEHSYYT